MAAFTPLSAKFAKVRFGSSALQLKRNASVANVNIGSGLP
jgi:hypothetical protein